MVVSANEQKVLDRASRILEREIKKQEDAMGSPAMVRQFLKCKLAALEHEVFCVMFLDSQNRLIEFSELFRGTLSSASVYPREVAKDALNCNAGSVILVHNHPSGIPEPSDADRRITRELQDALGLFDIRVLDHFIVANPDVTSFAERGWI